MSNPAIEIAEAFRDFWADEKTRMLAIPADLLSDVAEHNYSSANADFEQLKERYTPQQ